MSIGINKWNKKVIFCNNLKNFEKQKLTIYKKDDILYNANIDSQKDCTKGKKRNEWYIRYT